MRFLLIFLCVLCIFSCQKELKNSKATAISIGGVYWDTVSVNTPTLNIQDSLVLKTVYKINDSIFWMPLWFCEDSTYSCTGINLGYFGGYKRLVMHLKSDNTIEVIPDFYDGNFDILTYEQCSNPSYFDGRDYLFIDRCYDGPGSSEKRETHRLRLR